MIEGNQEISLFQKDEDADGSDEKYPGKRLRSGICGCSVRIWGHPGDGIDS
jgi:hypothetical protein